jgi:hypothetical protein
VQLLDAALLFTPLAGFRLQPQRQLGSVLVELAWSLSVRVLGLNNLVGQVLPEGVSRDARPACYLPYRHMITKMPTSDGA